MTYEEAYMQAETIKQLKEMVKHDIFIANFLNKDRLPIIAEAAQKIANIKFNGGNL